LTKLLISIEIRQVLSSLSEKDLECLIVWMLKNWADTLLGKL